MLDKPALGTFVASLAKRRIMLAGFSNRRQPSHIKRNDVRRGTRS